jgi:nitrate reductase assembly molybdenum cofactor insertion protein NarJ
MSLTMERAHQILDNPFNMLMAMERCLEREDEASADVIMALLMILNKALDLIEKQEQALDKG